MPNNTDPLAFASDADIANAAPNLKLPIPPRVRDGPEVPWIGPNHAAYCKAHAETIGEHVDDWWAKVRLNPPQWRAVAPGSSTAKAMFG